MASHLDSKIHMVLLTWWLTQQVMGLAEPAMLDMAPDAFDDQYQGCVKEMEGKASQLLQEDFNMTKQLKLEWEKAEKKWNEIKNTVSYPKGFHDSHGIALVAYTGKIYKDFNRAVREFKKSPHNFHYKAFHYYLTRALQLLRDENCLKVYRGTTTKFDYSGKGPVRFGQFTSSSLSEEVARKFASSNGTLFIIKTCLGVYIKAFSYVPNQEEVLIPGYEVYSKINEIQNGKDQYENITLDVPQREKSNFNCFYVNNSGVRESCELLLPVVLAGLLIQLLPLAEL